MPYLGNEVAPLVQALEGKELKLDSDGDSSIQASTDDTVVFKTNGSTAMTIDSSGRVLQPTIPAFRVGLTSSQNITTASSNIDIQWNDGTSSNSVNCFSQGGFSWNSGIVTVPIAGIYQFDVTTRIDSIGTSYILIKLVKNNVHSSNDEYYSIEGSPASDYQAVTVGGVFKCSANDTIRVTSFADGDSNYNISDASIFSGHFVG